MDKEIVKLFSTSIPCMNQLRCIKVRMDAKEIQNSSSESRYHGRILKCRLLIHLLPEIIASPIAGIDSNDIYILAKTEFLLTEKIARTLSALNIKYSEPVENITRQVYQVCLCYTILFKVAPQWNKVDKYLLRGENFLASLAYPTSAIKMNIVITDFETRLSLTQASVKVLPLSLAYFSLSPRILQNFVRNDNGFIILDGSGTQTWVYVLPSLKRGRVISISKQIPKTSPFRDYQQLRKHWNNMYGYRLPENEVGLIYYQIYFPGFGDNVYTYPDCCVRSNKLVQLRPDDSEETANQFLKDLTGKVREICGTSFFSKELHPAPTHSYSHSQRENQKENVPNMTSWLAQNARKIRNWEETSFNTQGSSTRDLTFSGSYIPPSVTSYRESDARRPALSKLFHNPERPTLDTTRDKNLRGASNRKPFLPVLVANRNGSASCSSPFHPIFENKLRKERSNILEIASSLHNEDQKLQELLFSERDAKVETICSAKSMKTDPDKWSAAEQTGNENDASMFSLLRTRSSFDLNDFGTATSKENTSDLIRDEILLSKREEVETESHYFKDLKNETKSTEKISQGTSSWKIKFHRLTDRKKITASKLPELKLEKKNRFDIAFRAKDISTYFKETKRVKVSNLVESTVKKSAAPKLIQTQLNIKGSGEVELCVEKNKHKFIDGNEGRY